MKAWRFIPLDVKNGSWNMAIDEAILTSVIEKKSSNTLRFYKWDPSTASLGRNQSLSEEVNEEFCKQKNYNIVRRITGGGAVFHDRDNEITYSIICPLSFLKSKGSYKVLDQFELITQGIVAGLSKYGLKSQKGVIHCPALFLDGKKFSGNAQIRRKGFLLQHGTILMDLDPDLMYTVLKTPENVSKSRMVRSVRAKCIGIKSQLEQYDEKKFIECLKIGFKETLDIKLYKGALTSYEYKLAEKLVNEKYRNQKWLKKYE
ncbi:MAG: hypothetical protein GF317_17180 [Candidatus Lokiarchaeota archaeon]|nr:hypothetical protein [Candidatus Lokiarchaeota archaeon]MBD3201246.1 hypothetical protein [Candidatus Lokiarchaeota archaeon]